MTTTNSQTHTTTTSTEVVIRPAPMSIRQIICGDILAGTPKSETKAKIEKFHGESAANAKFSVHYAWYKGKMKKDSNYFKKLA